MTRSILPLTLLLALATWVFGWWAVPVVAAGWTLLRQGRAPVWGAALAGALAWALLLIGTAVQGPAAELARRAGGAMQLPPWALVAVTLAFPALLAAAAAAVVARTRGVA
jgi:hypothetical protein